MEAFNDHDWEDATYLFKDLRKKYSYSRYARLADLRLADIDFQTDKLLESIQEYRTFVREHRTDSEVPYARYRICKGLFDQISDSVMLPPQEERDQATTVEGYRELRGVLADYPNGAYAKELRFMLRVITGRLVRHELYVARYYLRKNNLDGAAARAEYALKTYEGSGLEPEATVLLGETFLKMHKPDRAREVFGSVLRKYPESAFSVTAQNFLLELDRQGK